MHQLELEYFWPLTEQIKLDLDFKPCQEYHEQERRKMWATAASGSVLIANGGIGSTTWNTVNTTPSFHFRPEPDAVGYWLVNKDVHFWRKIRPNWLHQKMTKIFFGWEWKDK